MHAQATSNCTSTGTVVARYLQGLNIDEPLAMLRSSATSYYEADARGSGFVLANPELKKSITSLSNSSGTVTNTYAYNSFGNLLSSTGSVVNPFRFTARESDSETGLYFYRARYYDPSTGRFLSEDPIGFDGGVNWYTYTNNEPTLFLDPYGTSTQGALQTARDLANWLRGNNRNIIHIEDAATRDLSETPGMQDIRNQFKDKGCNYDRFLCNDYQYTQFRTTDNLTGQVVGSFCVKFVPVGNGKYLVEAQNTFGLASASRYIGGTNRKNPSVVDILRGRGPLMYPSSIWNTRSQVGFAT